MNALKSEIAAMILTDGPISLERYMALALGHPRHGYYTTRDPFGPAGDFVTAPEISQMFGELIGLWAAEVWAAMGRPAPVRLVELGPGRGTLMADFLRAAKILPAFADALDVHLVETSAVLAAAQSGRLASFSATRTTWHKTIDTLPEGPALVIANEFFDALPVRHYVKTARGWCERLVGLDAGETLVFGLAAEPDRAFDRPGPEGAIIEVNPAAASLMRQLADRFVRDGGASLVIDYGYGTPALGETLQAVRGHSFVDPLVDPGEADLTTHVDFGALGQVARAAGAAVHGPVEQGLFLCRLGLVERAEALKGGASAAVAAAIDAAVARLAGSGPASMGSLFKVIAVTAPTLSVPPGFSS